jgi:hypothetical protein
MSSRLLRGDDLELSRERRRDFDPVAEGDRHRLAAHVSRAIWERVCREVVDAGERDEQQLRLRFHQVAARVAARGGRLQRDPGRETRVENESVDADPGGDVFAMPVPGKATQVTVEVRRGEREGDDTESPTDDDTSGLVEGGPHDDGGVGHAVNATDPGARDRDGLADRFADAGSTRDLRGIWGELGILHTAQGPTAVQRAVEALAPDPRIRLGALLGVDLSFVRFERGTAADQFLDEIDADGAAVGATVYLRTGLGAQRTWELEAHELTHVAQTGGGASELWDEVSVAPPDSAVEQEAETVGQQLAAFQPLARPLEQSAPAGTVLRGKGKIVGWLVKVGERKLIKTTAIYSEKELVKLLGKGFNVLVRDGRQVAKRIAKKVWGDKILHHTGHIIKKTGKLGRSHFQPLRHGVGRAGEKGWHIFYSALPILFFSEEADAMVIYEDKYPGKSVANYLTITQYAGKDSWLSHLDWINPLELIAIGGDIGRDWDRERTKEMKALLFTREGPNGTIQTYELDPEGQLIKVYVQGHGGEKKEFTAQEYYELLGNAVEGTAVENEPPLADGTTDPNYAGTFDAEYRIYHSKQGWNWVRKTLSFFLPADAAAKLTRVGSFYVNYNAKIDYLYVLVHPSMRSVLHQPGFQIPPDLITSYAVAPNKEQFLQDMLTSAVTSEIMKNFDPTMAK